MLYIIANKRQAVDYGFSIRGHRVNGNLILLNEKEVESNPALSASNDNTLEERCKLISGTIFTHQGIIHELEQGGWNNG